ncbi:MAG: hypothetical protein P1U56_18075 [Saprospiraceae bacterium]|nr:hypothetical protein [Saprospiraceae bacterium]
MKRLLIVFAFIAFVAHENVAQHFLGIKGGIGLNMQQWNSYERDILFTPCIDVFAESNDDELNKLYASIGYHTRGSTVRGFGFNSFNPYKFNNLVAEIGGKRMVTTDKKYNGYYMLGLRAEYTLFTNLEGQNNSIYNLVSDVYVRKFNYGVSVGGGFEMAYGENNILFVEMSVHPDLSKQYEQLETLTIENPNPIPSPFPQSQFITIVPQEVRNVALEIKVGIKFSRGYYDEYE